MIDYANNSTVITRCSKCKYLRECRVVLKCGHPNGLKQPTYDSYCSYGEQKEEVPYEDKTN
jgi:hypothetical protein